MYPVMLNLHGQRCLVVGGGGVALRKVEGLLAEGAQVTVMALEPIRALQDLAGGGRIKLLPKAWAGGAGGYSLVYAATDDREVNRRVFEEATTAGTWVNVADDPELCTFHLPARVQRGTFQLAVASAGEAPFVVRRLRQFLERRFGPEWAEWMKAAARFRRGLRALGLPRDEQEKRYDQFFRGTVDTDRIAARVPTAAEEAQWLAVPDAPAAAARTAGGMPAGGADRGPESAAAHGPGTVTDRGPADASGDAGVTGRAPGLVSLVGAGPGDPGLLSLRGRQRLMAADAVVYDRLAATALPCDLPAHVELRPVGKEAGAHPVPQEEINALLVRLATSGKRVVRLKGGDPYIFGRGGEEAHALCAAGVPFEVVPCVTAGVAVAAYAGIPVTQRGEAVRLTMVTAHESSKSGGPQVRWDLMAADPNETVIGYMGVSALPEVAKKLLAAGMSPDTPAAMIERGTTSGQRVVRATIATLAEAITAAGLEPPALFVIGSTVRHADTLDWFTRRPLFGERIGAFAPAGAAGGALELAGAEMVEVPLPMTPAARVVMGALPLSGWLLNSADEVDAVEEERDGPCWDPSVVAWCLTSGAAERARALGWRHVEQIAAANSEALVAAVERHHAAVRATKRGPKGPVRTGGDP